MTYHFIRMFALAGAALSATLPAGAAEPRAVIELFTSQGCSSCPPADRLMGELAKDPSLVTLTLAVDYWDYLGWKDTLALRGHAERQRAYAQTRSDRNVYTPQVVVNGSVHVLGSDKSAIERAVAITQSGVARVPVAVAVAQGTVNVTVAAGGEGEVWLCPITRQVQVKIERGENKGNTFTYYNVVRGWTKLGDLNGQAQKFEVPVASVGGKDADAVAVIVQNTVQKKPGPTSGAALANLR